MSQQEDQQQNIINKEAFKNVDNTMVRELATGLSSTASLIHTLMEEIHENDRNVTETKTKLEGFSVTLQEMSKIIFGYGEARSVETKFEVFERDIVYIRKCLEEIERRIEKNKVKFNGKGIEINKNIDELKSKIDTFISNQELKKERVKGFWKWAAIVTVPAIGVLLIVLKLVFPDLDLSSFNLFFKP